MNWHQSQRSNHFQTVVLMLFIQLVLTASLIESLQDSSKNVIIIVLKIIINLTIMSSIIIGRYKITEKNMLYLLLLDRILVIVTISILQHPDCIFLVIQICYSIHITNDVVLSLEALLINITGKVGLMLQISLLSIHPLSFVCSSTLMLLDILEFHQVYKQKQHNTYLQNSLSELNSPGSNRRKNKQKDNEWVQRIQNMRIQVLILSYKSLKVKFMNSSFLDLCFCTNESELQEIILSKLNFQIPQYCTEIYKTTSIQIKKLRDRQKESSRKELANLESTKCNTAQSSLSLNEMLQEYIHGKYDELVNASSNKSLDISCTNKFINDTVISLSGSIHSDGKEITIFLNDISKQTEFSQQKTKEDFKAKIIKSFSHEMKTPLNSAKNLIESSLQEEQISQPIKDNMLLPAYNSLKLQSYIINDIIDFSNYYTNSLYLQTREFAFTELINEISELFQLQFQIKNMGFRFVMTKNELVTFNTDYCRLLQVIVNILQNSLKFCNNGNVMLTFSSIEHKYLKIKIKDDGVGIPPGQLAQIQSTLQQFQQTQDFTFNRQWHGFGLLISSILLSKISSNSEKQTLQIKSEGEGQGTTVIIIIENQQHIQSLMMSKKSLRLGSRISINHKIQFGTVIITQINQGRNENSFTPQFRKIENSQDMISLEKSSDFSLNYKIEQLDKNSPKLLTSLNNNNSSLSPMNASNIKNKISISQDPLSIQQYKDVRSGVSQKSQCFSYHQLKYIEDQESEQNLRQFEAKKKCNCKRLLSVDDEVFNQHSIQMLLSKLGFEVLLVTKYVDQAFNGYQAIEMIKTLKKCCENCQILSFILMDYQMPILDGIATTQQLNTMMREGQLPFINIIGLTAFTSEEDIRKCLNAGMFDVLSKPLNLKEFKELLSLL